VPQIAKIENKDFRAGDGVGSGGITVEHWDHTDFPWLSVFTGKRNPDGTVTACPMYMTVAGIREYAAWLLTQADELEKANNTPAPVQRKRRVRKAAA
jgi:hypothetical protein